MTNFIKSISNYNLNIPFTSPSSSEVCSSFTIQIFIWKGDKYLPPTVPTQEIIKNNLDQSSGTAKINISDIVNDYIETEIENAITTDVLDNTNTVWVKTQVLYVTTDISDIDLPQLVDTRLGVKGYGFGKESENPQPPINKILMPIFEYNVSKNSVFNMAFLREEGDPPSPVYTATLDSIILIPTSLSIAWTDDIPAELRSYATIDVSLLSDMSVLEASYTGDPEPPRIIPLGGLPEALLYFQVTTFDSNGFFAVSNILSYDNS